ncbi:rab-GTPase-TBC domain-containing protein [Apodospora peruviana]|uniref:GTPase-activating protein GYP5 n=1 Tax=Apodospora peruviana TaxID=516989 RepID=A0AAE0HY31_9PEZI|nr:rab-GTPase-TBC domain-containing protein [Apodospora peruviana]
MSALAEAPATEPQEKETQVTLGTQDLEEEGQRSPTDLSDKETDTFEDAVDTGSIRSLTKRKASLNRQTSEENADSDVDDEVPPPVPEQVDGAEAVNETPEEKALHRQSISQASDVSLDNVNLDDDAAAAAQSIKSPELPPRALEVSTREADKGVVPKEASAKKMSFSGITNALPAMPWSPPAGDSHSRSPSTTVAPATAAPHLPPPPVSRKLTSPFSWLSRNSSKDQAVVPPAAVSPRRNTASSVATMSSNPEMMLGKLDEEKDGEAKGGKTRPRNSSLKDRFKQLRMRDEAGIQVPVGEDDKTGGDDKATLAVQPPPSPLPSPSRTLAPGTASGANVGPSTHPETPVNWDLWQSVVYEGPAAVARTSSEELNKAIATGIPSAIRGVIWQVLAQSKNEELENVYRDLVARGTDKEKDRQSNGASISAASNTGGKDSPSSSASSVHSEKSGPNGNRAPSPTDKDSDSFLRAQAVAAADRKKKDKEDMVMLQKLEKTIKRDLGARTSFSKFAAAQGLQEGLFGVCKAYALFDEGVGYAQGMNFLVMPILFNMPEEEAFCLLVRLMNQYHLRDLFIQDMPGLHMHLYQFERLLEDLEPALYCHLHRKGISPHLYATQWFLTLFAYRFPLQLVLRIYDLIFSEGLSAILKFGIVLMQKNAATLLSMSDMSQLTVFLKDRLFDVYIDASPSSNSILENGFFGSSSSSIDKEVYRADQLVLDACAVKITPELLKSYAAEWEEKTRAEKEREAELDHLRSSNANYAIRMRRLEERIEAVDHEQAALATDLVHHKVENEELKDENESLKGQVRELRVVIAQQPAEIEQKWQLERDDLMKRNAKVHEDNQRLEKELSELEEELVQTKMRYAEINSQHETLTQKWNELKRQFA